MADDLKNPTRKDIGLSVDPEMTKQNGADAPDATSVAKASDAGLAIQISCVKCERPNDTKAKYKAITCNFCEKWTCFKCAELNTKQIELFDRGNLFFACDSCQDAVSKFAEGMRSNHGTVPPAAQKSNAVSSVGSDVRVDQQLVVLKSEIEQRFSDLENLIKQTQGDIANSVSTCVETAVTSNVSKAMDNVSDKVGKTVETSWARCVGDGKHAVVTNSPEETQKFITVHSKRVAREIKKEETRSESRLKNLVIFGAPEVENEKKEDRQQKDKDLVQKLLNEIGVTHDPETIYRVGLPGSHKVNTDRNHSGRILKVVFKSGDAITSVMSNARKLKDAADDLKCLSLEYDMSDDERDILRNKLKEARDLNSKKPQRIHKVRGPPWHRRIVWFQKQQN